MKKKKYRVVARSTGLLTWPLKYLAQRQTIFGWMEINWSYNFDAAVGYIKQYHANNYEEKTEKLPDKIVREMEL